MWRLIFLFVLILLIMFAIYPFLVQFDIKFNVLKLRGEVAITIFNKFKIDFKIRIKHGYIYINHKNKERKEKISNKNFSVVLILNLINQLYFREQFLDLTILANFGYVLDSRVTATICGYIDVISKSLLGPIKNNKKSSHIFVSVEPKYNEDVLNARVRNIVRISFLDIVYTLFYTFIHARGKYEKVWYCKTWR